MYMDNTQFLWEEKNSIAQMKKYQCETTVNLNDITSETPKKLNSSECKNTGSQNNWHRKCKNCNRLITYKEKICLDRAIKHDKPCRSCSGKIKENLVGKQFGSLIITNQYIGPAGKTLVDYICECKHKTLKVGAYFANVKNQRNCSKCRGKEGNNIINPRGVTSFNAYYNSYYQNAKLKNRDFKLTKEEFKTITQQNCFYCNTEPLKAFRPNNINNGEYLTNGIDRKNNDIGYIFENCVSCCSMCNFLKGTLSIDVFLTQIRRIVEFTNKVKI